jgi:hypothetical protein
MDKDGSRFSALLLSCQDRTRLRRRAVSLTMTIVALLIHFPLAMVYGRIVGRVVRGRTPCMLLSWGWRLGLAIYGLNFWLIAPLTFPWFEQSRGLITAFDHCLFGATAGVSCVFLRRRLRST